MDGLLRNCATGCRVDEAFTMDDLVDSISADTSGLRCGHVQLRIVFITPCLMALVLDDSEVLELTLTPSKFGPVPRGSPMSYLCPPEKDTGFILHHMAPEFPTLPLMQHSLSSLHFVPTIHQLMHLQSLQVSAEMSSECEKGTREQSKCPAWAQLRRSRLTASRFRGACCYKKGSVEQESAAKALAAQMIRGSARQTTGMKRGLLMESEPMTSYGATRKYKGVPGETASISSSFGPVLSDCIYTNSGLVDELVGKFEKVLFSLNFPGAGESDRMTMTFVFDVITSGGECSSGWCMRAAVCLGRASRRAAAAVRVC
ncbi:hypothetical protein DPX16_14586 [Anabarilius grahami]|uniref:Uncharacterized protein n=1 Tax=Anabarilius grahami TaxID=495550 RepID=A0A3N0YXM3_ANAGA|nr:hypothetical protein DPX16_14586 [Anabarilius grahami]